MGKIYAVKNGRTPGLYSSWADCEAQVKGFSGALYKSFTTRAEADAYMSPLTSAPAPAPISPPVTELHIYTDGSASKHGPTQPLGLGAWCRYQGQDYVLARSGHPPLLDKYQLTGVVCSNPTAEFLAFAEVVEKFVDRPLSVSKLVFHIDYVGVQHWMEGSWQANKPYIAHLQDVCRGHLQRIACPVEMVHVAGHSGVEGNEQADRLAGSGNEVDTFGDLLQVVSL